MPMPPGAHRQVPASLATGFTISRGCVAEQDIARKMPFHTISQSLEAAAARFQADAPLRYFAQDLRHFR